VILFILVRIIGLQEHILKCYLRTDFISSA